MLEQLDEEDMKLRDVDPKIARQSRIYNAYMDSNGFIVELNGLIMD